DPYAIGPRDHLHRPGPDRPATPGAVEVPQAISRAQLPFAPEWLLRLCAHHAPCGPATAVGCRGKGSTRPVVGCAGGGMRRWWNAPVVECAGGGMRRSGIKT